MQTDNQKLQKLYLEVADLTHLMNLLTEENRLLRDYAYNVDPNAIIMH